MSFELEVRNNMLPGKSRILCQAIPTLYILQEAFDRLISCRKFEGDTQEVWIELQQGTPSKAYGAAMEEYEQLASATIKFHRFKNNGVDVWLYLGPVLR